MRLFWQMMLAVSVGLFIGCGSDGGGSGDSGNDEAGTTGMMTGDEGTTGGSTDGATTDAGTTAGGTTDAGTTGGGSTEAGGTTGPVDPPAPSCEPGTVQCDANKVVACMNNGAGWYDVEVCAEGTSCNPDSASCEAGCVPHCAAKECGDDGCGGTCGTCPGGAVCTEFSQCGSPDMCFPSGTGIKVGDQIKDLDYTDTTGQALQLHSYCGMKEVVLLIETAGW